MGTAFAQALTVEELVALAAVSVKHRKQQAIPDYPIPHLRGAAQELWQSEDHEAMIAGPAETGKTWAALYKADYLARTHGGSQGAIVRKTYKSVHGTVLQTFRRILALCVEKGLPMPHSYGGEKTEWYDYPNGSRIYVGGMDNPDKVLSSERDFIYFNQAEEASLDDWETLTTRCTGRGGVMPFAQIYGDCNPGPSTHWILSRHSLRLLYSHHEDNPTLYDDGGNLTDQGCKTMAVLDSLTGTRYQRLRLGKWVGSEGVVYGDWSREQHLVTEAQLREWGIIV